MTVPEGFVALPSQMGSVRMPVPWAHLSKSGTLTLNVHAVALLDGAGRFVLHHNARTGELLLVPGDAEGSRHLTGNGSVRVKQVNLAGQVRRGLLPAGGAGYRVTRAHGGLLLVPATDADAADLAAGNASGRGA